MIKMPLSETEIKALRVIRNWIVQKGKIPSVRALKDELGFSSPRTGAMLIKKLIAKGYLGEREDGKPYLRSDAGDHTIFAKTIDIPLVGAVACGTPLLAEQNIEAMIPISTQIARHPHRYFLLKAKGDSMNLKGIHDGDLVLVKQQPSAKNGEPVVALIDDEATIKEIHYSDSAIVLKPCSTNKMHKPIVLTTDFQIQGIAIKSIPKEAIYG